MNKTATDGAILQHTWGNSLLTTVVGNELLESCLVYHYGGLKTCDHDRIVWICVSRPLLDYSHCWSVGLSQGDRYKGSTNEVLAESGRKKAFTLIILPKAHWLWETACNTLLPGISPDIPENGQFGPESNLWYKHTICIVLQPIRYFWTAAHVQTLTAAFVYVLLKSICSIFKS